MALLDRTARSLLLLEIASGMWLTLKYFFKAKVTITMANKMVSNALLGVVSRALVALAIIWGICSPIRTNMAPFRANWMVSQTAVRRRRVVGRVRVRCSI